MRCRQGHYSIPYNRSYAMLTGKYLELYNRLMGIIPEKRLIQDDLRCLAYGTDASFYRYVPQIIIIVESDLEVLRVIKECRELKLPMTFRAAGTSLSGQAQSDSVLLMLGPKGWQDYSISENLDEITLQSGILGATANSYLAPYGKKIGPDPASINSAKIGGIVSNNACGMASGIELNSLHTLRHMKMIFSDGTVLDTRDEHSRIQFLQDKKEWIDRLDAIARRLSENHDLLQRINRKYMIKNTTGYSIKALTAHEDPIERIQHLMVGSEGTLAFISDVTFRTADDPKEKATTLLLFPDIASACEAVLLLRECNVAAAELIDRVGLRTVENKPGMPSYIRELGDTVTALLTETAGYTGEEVEANIKEINEKLKGTVMAHDYEFTRDPVKQARLWNIRKGLFPSACSERKTGTTVIIEDIAVPVEVLGQCLLALQDLFAKYHYENTVIWGHVFDGNVHFVLTKDFTDPAMVRKYSDFMDEVVDLVVKKYDGSLKAEHGTGRNMAPFVEKEWGPEIYAAMKEVKEILDPDNLFNPGVIINDDIEVHLKNFKPMPAAHDLIDICIECGFCERNCMSNGFTLSARQRIVIYREMERLKKTGENPGLLKKLEKDFDYLGDQTCAADGLCALGCPVEINTGELIKELRKEKAASVARKIAAWIGRSMAGVTGSARAALAMVNLFHSILGSTLMTLITKGARKLSGNTLPLWTPAMPKNAARVRPEAAFYEGVHRVVYFPSCITRTMGVSKDHREAESLTRATENLIRKAGYQIIYPEGLDNLCCGMAFNSKGFKKTAKEKSDELGAALKKASENGRYPILCDMSPCLHHMKETLEPGLKLYEPIEFTLEILEPKLDFTPMQGIIAVHPVCSAKKMGLEDKLMKLARMCCTNVVKPEVNCCGFAGDRGFTYPELNEYGLRNLKKQIPEGCNEGFSTSRTCEIGLTYHGGISYKSILYLVDRVTTPKGK